MVAAGCTLTDPRIDDADRTPRPIPSPTPLPGTEKAAESEQELALLASALAADTGGDLDDGQRAALQQLATGHREHTTALLSPEPTTGPRSTASPSASPTSSSDPLDGRSPQAAIKALLASEQDQSATYLEFAAKTSGYTSLFWASLAAAAVAYAEALSTKITPADPEKADRSAAPLAPVTDVEAVQELLRQTFAIIYGYQLALAQLSGAARDRAASRLTGLRQLRDDLTANLTDRQAAVPVAEPAYKTPSKINNEKSAIGLLRSMETKLFPFCGQVVSGSADTSTRSLGVTALMGGSTAAQGWGSSLPAWPGWPAQS